MIRRHCSPPCWPLPLAQPAARPPAASFRDRLPEDEVIYFVLPDRFENGDPANDRGGLTGDRLDDRLRSRPPRASTTAAT